MDISEFDIKKLLNKIPVTCLEEDHIVTILYNLLCALNFIHSAGVIHRSLQPSNFLIDSECTVLICDFG